MKKVLIYLCATAFIFVLCSCGKKDGVTKAVDFEDYTLNEVISWAEENGLSDKFSFVFRNDAVEPVEPFGHVLGQSVACGMPITDGIEITVSTGNMLLSAEGTAAVVPNVIGKSFTDAKNELQSNGFSVDSRYEPSSKEKDTVLLSDPLPGMSAAQGSKIVLTLSSGEFRGTSVSVTLRLRPSSDNNTVKVFVDGDLDRSKTVCLDPSVTSKAFTFAGTGKIQVKFTVNDEYTVRYEIDFEARKATLTE